jgi:hypothetical protein
LRPTTALVNHRASPRWGKNIPPLLNRWSPCQPPSRGAPGLNAANSSGATKVCRRGGSLTPQLAFRGGRSPLTACSGIAATGTGAPTER